MGFDLTQLSYYSGNQIQQTAFASLSPIRCEEIMHQADNTPVSKRVPNCQKCGQHGRKSRLKGHKRVCPYRDCECAKCQVVSERQKLMADQIKIRRRQRKDTLLNITRENITATLNAAAAVAASGPLPYFHNFNALFYKQLQQNMRQPAVAAFLPSNSPPSDRMMEAAAFNSTSANLSNYLTNSAPTSKLGQQTPQHHQQQPQHQQQQASPSSLPHLQFLLQPQATTPTTTTTSTLADGDMPLHSLTPPCNQSEDNVLIGNNPPIAVPVPINPIAVSALAPNLSAQDVLSRTLQHQQHQHHHHHQQQQQQHQQEHQQHHHQQRELSTLNVNQSLANGQISAFLENEQLFQTLLNNMRQLERKISVEAAKVAAATAAIPDSSSGSGSSSRPETTNHLPGIFVDVCSV